MLDIEADAPTPFEDVPDVGNLLALAESLNVDPIALDEAVHDAAARYASDECNSSGAVDDDGAVDEIYDEAGHQAAQINNGGLTRQVPYLVAQYGAASAEGILRAAAP